MLTDIAGVTVGHWTDSVAKTGCTVIVLPPETVASGEVRGGAPASRDFALLDPTKTVQHVDAVVLSGGSAFGLAASDGVMSVLAERGRGFETKSGRVPIVVGLSLFDLGVGDGSVRPGPVEGRAAIEAASDGDVALGLVGAGTGATVAKWHGREASTPAGIGGATLRSGDLVVSALIAVNAYGSIDDGSTLTDPGPPVLGSDADDAGSGDGDSGDADSGPSEAAGLDTGGSMTNTTIGVIATNAVVDKIGCQLLAQSGHDGLARSLFPAHTAADGDALVAAATGQIETDLAHLRVLAQLAVAQAVRSVGAVGLSRS